MAKLISKLRQLVRLKGAFQQDMDSRDATDMPPLDQVMDDQVVKQLMRMIELTNEEEYSCEEAFAVLDEYIDLALHHQEASRLMPLVKRHLELCVDCQDEFEVLLRALQPDPASTGEQT
jgi:hypothetical protein